MRPWTLWYRDRDTLLEQFELPLLLNEIIVILHQMMAEFMSPKSVTQKRIRLDATGYI